MKDRFVLTEVRSILTAGLLLALGASIAVAQSPVQVRYVTGIQTKGDSFVNITNDGANSTKNGAASPFFSTGGDLCVGVYFFDPNETLQSCCTCEVTPNGLISLSVKTNNLNNLTSAFPDSEVIKLLAWAATSAQPTTNAPGSPISPTPPASICNAANPGTPVSGLHAWATTLHSRPAPATGFAVTETEFSQGILSDAEFNRVKMLCAFAQQVGSVTFGQCRGCQSGGLGAAGTQ